MISPSIRFGGCRQRALLALEQPVGLVHETVHPRTPPLR
jgi:hypothetical protein